MSILKVYDEFLEKKCAKIFEKIAIEGGGSQKWSKIRPIGFRMAPKHNEKIISTIVYFL